MYKRQAQGSRSPGQSSNGYNPQHANEAYTNLSLIHILFMKDGKVVAQGSPCDVVTPDLIQRVFSVPCQIIDDPETGAPLVIPRR